MGNPFEKGRIPLDLLPYANSSIITMHAMNSFNPLSIGPKCGCSKHSDRRCSRLSKWMRESGAHVEPHFYINIVDNADETEQQHLEDQLHGSTKPAVNAAAWGAIKLDISRTYPSMNFFRNEGQQQLFRVLRAYAFYDPEVGYVQGMNFLVACLLWHGTEEQAFWTLVAMMVNYDLRSMFLPGLPGLQKRAGVVEQLIAQNFPDLMQHLLDVGISAQLVSTDWLLTLFSYSVPLEPLAELWDLFFEEGWSAIYRIILIRIKALESRLMETNDLAELMAILKFAPPPVGFQSATIAQKGVFGLASAVFSRFDSINTLNPVKKITKTLINKATQSMNTSHNSALSSPPTSENVHCVNLRPSLAAATIGDNVNIAERGRLLPDEEYSRAVEGWHELVAECRRNKKLVDNIMAKDLEDVYAELVKVQSDRSRMMKSDTSKKDEDWEMLEKF
eukprot:GDKJ01020904.1.p1 GENE.GDKJ01020904.1~~GDKJ01020904.1.p1  ORF type:complete len:447 (-),score=60.43 GDKJ01020904.1:55-1395(-)